MQPVMAGARSLHVGACEASFESAMLASMTGASSHLGGGGLVLRLLGLALDDHVIIR